MQVLAHHDAHKDHRHRSKSGGQGGRYSKQDYKRADNLDAADDDPLGQMVRALADVKKVVDHATHHIARAVRVEIRKAEALVLVK